MALAVTRSDIERIYPVIADHIRRTPVVTISGEDVGMPPFSLTLKLEQLQHEDDRTRGKLTLLKRAKARAQRIRAAEAASGRKRR